MNIKINFKKQVFNRPNENLIFFVDENFNISSLKKSISKSDYSYVSDLIKTRDTKKKIITFNISSKKKIILVSINKNITNSEIENLGADCYNIVKELKKSNFFELLFLSELSFKFKSSDITLAVEVKACLSFSFKFSLLLLFFI